MTTLVIHASHDVSARSLDLAKGGCLIIDVNDRNGRRLSDIEIYLSNHVLAGALAQAINSVTSIEITDPTPDLPEASRSGHYS